MSKVSQKIVASGMSLVLAVGLMPMPAFAADGDLAAGSGNLSTQAVMKYISSSNLTFTTPTQHVYDGTAFKPAPTITWNGVTLVEGTDYTLEYLYEPYSYDDDDDDYDYSQTVATDFTKVGSYEVVARGTGAYQGTAYGRFQIVKESTDYSLSAEFTDDANAGRTYSAVYYHTGSAITPSIAVTKYDYSSETRTPLVLGTDYTVEYTQESYDQETYDYVERTIAAPTEIGYYHLVITYLGKYAERGKNTLYFEIKDPKKLSYNNAFFPDKDVFTYTGQAINPKPMVVVNGAVLTEGVDYVLKYQQYDSEKGDIAATPVEPGSYECVVEGLGTYAGTQDNPNSVTVDFTIVKGNDLEDGNTEVLFTSGNVVAYTGSAITAPKPIVTYKGKTLVEGTDYEVTTVEDKIVDVGDYTLRIIGKGNYFGTETAQFQVYKVDTTLSGATIVMPNGYNFAYTGKAIMPKPSKVQLANDGATLNEGTDYTVAYRISSRYGYAPINEPIEVGSYEVVLIGKGNYAGQTATRYFSIVEKNDLSAASVSMNSLYTYNGKAVKPAPVITLAGKKLKKGTDYTLEYYTQSGANYANGYAGQKKIASPKNAGAYTVVISPKGSKYVGGITRTFTIKAASLSAGEASATLKKEVLPYTGKNLKPTVVVKVNGKKVATNQYNVSYPVESSAMGYYTVTVSGKNNLTGSTTLTYSIGPKNAKLSKVTAASKGFTAKWKKITKNNKGYQIRYSLKKDMSKAKTKTVKKAKKTSLKVSKLKSGKKYYVQIRTMTKSGGVTYYGNWSASKTVTTK